VVSSPLRGFRWRPRLRTAQSFPTKPVRILVPYAAGAAVDVLARTLGQSLSKSWGQQPVIENRPGAGGIIASQALTQSAPDGYTLILVASVAGYEASVWWGVLGPAGMAPDLVAKVHADLAAALNDPVVQAALEKMGATPVGSSPADFDAFMRGEAKKWEPMLKEADIKMQ
jgi:tripartite-type tricarboxylate transporter receptor subunit TctC